MIPYHMSTWLLGLAALVQPLALADEPPPLPVRAVAFSPDGRWLAVGAGEQPERGQVTLWDLDTLKVRWTHLHPAAVLSVAFSPDGKLLALGAMGADATLLEAESGKQRVQLPGHGKAARVVAFAPDGKSLLVGSYDRFIKRWDVATHQELQTLEGHAGKVFGLSVSGDGVLLVSLAEDGVKLWELAGAKKLHTWAYGGHGSIRSARITGDGKWVLTGGYDGTVRVWNARTAAARCKFQNLSGVVGMALHTPSAKLAVNGFSDDITILDINLKEPAPDQAAALRQLLRELDDESYRVREAASGKLVELGTVAEQALDRAARDHPSVEVRIRARRARDELLRESRVTFPAPFAKVQVLAFSPDGQLLALGARDGSVSLWNIAEEKETARLQPTTSGKKQSRPRN